MTKPMPLDAFTRLPPLLAVERVDGLAASIDRVAAQAAPSHRFLRYGWYAAALKAYGGAARTLTVMREAAPVAALPIVPVGPRWLRIVGVPGCYWPFRSFPVAEDAGVEAMEALLPRLGREANALRVGPVYDGDPGLELLKAAATAQGWAVLDRFLGESWLLDIEGLNRTGQWPRSSTLRKNRNRERQLSTQGALEWRFLSGADWPEALAVLKLVEARSWVGTRTDRTGAKFQADGHGAFWRAALGDSAIAAMTRGALLTVGGVPAAFSFDLDLGDVKHTIANGYDPAFARHSPGNLLHYRNLAEARARGVAQVDWGAGDSGYKEEMGAVPGPAIRDWIFVRPGLPALAARGLAGAWRRSGHRERGTEAEPPASSPDADRDL